MISDMIDMESNMTSDQTSYITYDRISVKIFDKTSELDCSIVACTF